MLLSQNVLFRTIQLLSLATRGNNKILRTPPPHSSSSEERLPRLTHHTLDQLGTNKSSFLSFGSKVRPRTFGCVAMGSALLFIVRSRLLVYSAGSGVNRVQVVLSGFSKRLFCFVQAKTLCRYGCMYFLAALVLVCVDVIVMSSA